MSIIDEIRAEREELSRVLKKHKGIRKIVEDLYPDNAHFIYELLQNAEDADASVAAFRLQEDRLIFEHDGDPFEPEDIEGITDIGEGTKSGEDDKIGRFGIGFKSVFSYTETPRIWSPTYSFEIRDFVLPYEIKPPANLVGLTRFEFPFKNGKKPPAEAFREVEKGLSGLDQTTLLFLSRLKRLSWESSQSPRCEIQLVEHPRHHVEIIKTKAGMGSTSSHFLCFHEPAAGLPKMSCAAAYLMEFLPNVTQFRQDKPLNRQLKIVPADPARVAVFFPAESETSGLRLHLHAPFVTTPDRATIKDVATNRPLFEQLARLTASSLHEIKDLGLLTTEFLGVLPNLRDQLSDRYTVIRKAVVDEMRAKPLTPVHGGGHAPARELLQGPSALKEILRPEDLEVLVRRNSTALQWAASAPQQNSNSDRFLEGLQINRWGFDEFIKLIEKGATLRYRWEQGLHVLEKTLDPAFMSWLATKPVDWHQHLYAMLDKRIDASDDDCLDRLEEAHIVRLASGEYSMGSACFFREGNDTHDDVLPPVDPGVYSSGRSESQKAAAKAFLVRLGVREVGEAEQVEAILKKRYVDGAPIDSDRVYLGDMRRFIALLDKTPDKAALFHEHPIFRDTDDDWLRPEQIYLDSPYRDTGLHQWYAARGNEADCYALSSWYETCGIPLQKLARFAEQVGARTGLTIEEVTCEDNPDWNKLRQAPGERFTSSQLNQDYQIPGLDDVLRVQNLLCSKLVWNALGSLPRYAWQYMQAVYRRSQRAGSVSAPSQLVHSLKQAEWIPQGDGIFVKPRLAVREKLPEGFPFDPGWFWLEELEFGEEAQRRSAAHQKVLHHAKELGFADEKALERAKKFAELVPPEQQEAFLAGFATKRPIDLPIKTPRNPERRKDKISSDAQQAPIRKTEQRRRSVSVDADEVSKSAREYLRYQYSNTDNQMICQICQDELPFKLSDGSYYFEAVELLSELRCRHHYAFMALCPNHAAMFKHANPAADKMLPQVLELTGPRLSLQLADRTHSIYFTETHLHDLKVVIEAERNPTA